MVFSCSRNFHVFSSHSLPYGGQLINNTSLHEPPNALITCWLFPPLRFSLFVEKFLLHKWATEGDAYIHRLLSVDQISQALGSSSSCHRCRRRRRRTRFPATGYARRGSLSSCEPILTSFHRLLHNTLCNDIPFFLPAERNICGDEYKMNIPFVIRDGASQERRRIGTRKEEEFVELPERETLRA
jgi:hypothetical protein